MDTNEGEVYFALDADDFDLDEVTTFLGVDLHDRLIQIRLLFALKIHPFEINKKSFKS